jgi:hypothetical protein
MSRLVQAIRVFGPPKEGKAWMPGTKPGMTNKGAIAL